MKTVRILAVGKLKDRLLEQACADYLARCRRRFTAQVSEVKDLNALGKAIPARCTLVALDERGEQQTSRQFARALQTWLNRPEPSVVFLIGGADGLDQSTKKRANYLVSLSKMTLPHRLARLILTEQLYRAVSILDNAPYHRD